MLKAFVESLVNYEYLMWLVMTCFLLGTNCSLACFIFSHKDSTITKQYNRSQLVTIFGKSSD